LPGQQTGLGQPHCTQICGGPSAQYLKSGGQHLVLQLG
jgi:hypothetical protein